MELKKLKTKHLTQAKSQQTDAGTLPIDWVVLPLSELLQSKQLGGNYKNGMLETEWPLIKMGNLGRGRIDCSKIDFVHTLSPPSAKDRLHTDDVLFNTRNTLDLVGKVAIWRNELPKAYFNSNIMRMTFDPDRVGSNAYMNYVLNTRRSITALRAIATGTTSVAAIYSRDFANIHLPLPHNKTEQKSIASVLTNAESLTVLLEQLLTKKRQIKQGAMQELLTGKRRLPGFIHLWQSRSFSELAKIKRGASPRPIDDLVWFDDSSSVGWVRISDVTQSGMFLHSTTQRLSDAGIRKSRFVGKGNLIMSICATVGRPVITALDTCIHDGFVLFDSLTINQKFLYYALLQIEDDWSAHGQTGSQMNLNTGLINRTRIPVPDDVEEQCAIASVLFDMDTDLATVESRLTKARALKQAMAQALLTGRIRLVEPTA